MSWDAAHVIACLRDFVSGQPTPAVNTNWEAAGCEVWDASATVYGSEVLVEQGAGGMLSALAAAALDRPLDQRSARAGEIAVGVLANIASHTQLQQHLLDQGGLAPLVADRVLWADDAAVVTEGCRLSTSLLLSRQVG